ncbi:4-hydroxy-tetrahydrodipicolinate synthase [Acetanaerobacterium elongatum]|uniref:4-hydroxy-tetrahydrodipicolinate synthase n=1 Tax=Acetanaerobacterium elongatum TaxID=258515 RepID=A0A1H0BD52_9FIRM|nr:4-hydroxy-tetrahydrodipicolinate synthase [Acetanaerobacterium elongatum]SDN43556.1 dihydrodipicolinate synthase [Acetanaerobacterium elongatum]
MKKTVFTGAGCAIVTPMNPDGTINYTLLSELIDYQIQNSTDAIVIAGTTGESSTFTDAEHINVLHYAVKAVNGRVPVVAGAGSNDTSYAVALSKEAKIAGVDALLHVTPYYNKTSQKGLVKHFTAIADATDLPMILYNVPSRTGMNIGINAYKELAKHPNIVATKEASGNISAIAQVAAECGDELTIYSGNDDQILPILALGGKGVISVLSNIMPKETHDICQLFFDGDIKASTKLQLELLELMNNLFIDVNPIPVKAALKLMGYPVGDCRPPLDTLSDEHTAVLKASLEKYGLLKAPRN